MRKRLFCVGLVLIGILTCQWAAAVNQVDVTIDKGCVLKYDDGTSADPVEADRNDFVVWHNSRVSEAVVITFTGASPFSVSEITVPANGQVSRQVRSDAEETDYDFDLTCGGDTRTGPKLSIGGGGP
ncbi:hypothetical protein H8E07_12600 [bacterium]|nr:hypothetical protein [bacterium]